MFHSTGAARRDHGNPHGVRKRTRQLDIVTVARAITIHARQKYLTCSELFSLPRPLDRVAAHRATTTVCVNFPTALRTPARIDRDYNALTAKRLRICFDQIRIFNSRGVQSYLVSPRTQNRANVFNRAQTAADCKRNKNLVGYATHQIRDNLATVRRRCDIEKRQFISAFEIVTLRLRHRITRIRQRNKANPLDHAAVINIKTWDDPLRKHLFNHRYTQIRVNRFTQIRVHLWQSFSTSSTPHPDSSRDETARHKYSLARQPTHIAAHTQSRLPQPLHHAADSKTSARNNKTLHPQHHQTTHDPASGEFDSTQLAALQARFQTSAHFPPAVRVQASIQTHPTLQTTSASQRRHPARAFPPSPFEELKDRSRAPSAPSYRRETPLHLAAQVVRHDAKSLRQN